MRPPPSCPVAEAEPRPVYGLLLGDALPGLRERVAVRLECLADRPA